MTKLHIWEGDRTFFNRVAVEMDAVDATMAIHYLAKFLYLYYGKTKEPGEQVPLALSS